MIDLSPYKKEAVELLIKLIAIQSISREEDETADLIEAHLEVNDIETFRKENNVWARNKYYDDKQTHHFAQLSPRHR